MPSWAAPALVLLHRLGGSIDAILRENYDSVIAMERLNEALERIDSSFQFALAGRRRTKARQQYRRTTGSRTIKPCTSNRTTSPLSRAKAGPGRPADGIDLGNTAGRATRSSTGRRRSGGTATTSDRAACSMLFEQIKKVVGEILRVNQDNMEQASREAPRRRQLSLVWFGVGLAVVAVVLASGSRPGTSSARSSGRSRP